MRVMTDTCLGNECDFAAELFVAFGNHAGVFIPGHDIIGVAINMQQRHFRSRERRQSIDRVSYHRPIIPAFYDARHGW